MKKVGLLFVLLTFTMTITLFTGCTPSQSHTGTGDPPSPYDSMIPYDAALNLEIMDGQFRFQRIATSPCIVYSPTPITDMADGTGYEDGHNILMALFQATDGKKAMMDITECEFSHYIYLFDKEHDNIPWHYRFAICDCGAVRITNNDELICTVMISKEEIQSILNALKG